MRMRMVKNDPNTQTQEIKKQDSATLPAEGTFQEFDPTKPVDPSLPNPPQIKLG